MTVLVLRLAVRAGGGLLFFFLSLRLAAHFGVIAPHGFCHFDLLSVLGGHVCQKIIVVKYVARYVATYVVTYYVAIRVVIYIYIYICLRCA